MNMDRTDTLIVQQEEIARLDDECNTLTIRVNHLICLLEEVGELVEGAVDITAKGGPNLAMQIKTILDRK